VLDIVGKRRWYYAISLGVLIPGLIFTLLTLIPNGDLGLRFSIAYTGGTEWTIHFANGAPEPQAVVAVLEEADLPGSEVLTQTTGDKQYTLIRTSALALGEGSGSSLAPAASPAPGASSAPVASASPAASPAMAASGAASSTATGRLADVRVALEAAFGPIDDELELVTIGPVVSAELVQQTFLLVLMGALGIMLWITYRFRDFRMAPRPRHAAP